MPYLTTNSNEYTSFHAIDHWIGKKSIRVISKPGIANWDRITPSQELLVEHIHPDPGQKLLYYGYGNAAALISMAVNYPESQFLAFDPNSIALKGGRLSVTETKSANVILLEGTDHLSEAQGLIDIAVIDIAKGRELNRRWLMEGIQNLEKDGKFFITGSNQAGIRSITDDLSTLFKNIHVIDYKKGNRLVKSTLRKEINEIPDWCSQPGISPGSWKEIHVNLKNKTYPFLTLPGVFSANHLDPGTSFLIENLSIRKGERILDFGCGWGPIGVWAALQGADWVDFLDSNLLAIACVEENCRKLQLTNTRFYQSDILMDVLPNRYDQIISNLPFHTGHEIDYSITNAFIEQSYQVLNPKGRLTLVANSFLQYDQWLQKSFKTVECVAKNNQYSVWQARK